MNEFKKILSFLKATPSQDVVEGEGGAVYFLGIGGIGMSAIARYFNSLGVQVSGYDKTATALTGQLESEGIHIHFDDDLDLIDKSAQFVVYTPAVPADHKGLNFYRENNYTVVKRSDVLGAITQSSFNICVAGTHGKTTTSTMVAHILRHTEYGCNAFLGGTSGNYNTNFWSSPNNVAVVEADEYDRSFLKLSPDVSIISSMDPDHLDIYGTAENMEQAFIDFSARLKPGGLLISRYGLKRSNDLTATHHISYDVNNAAAGITATNIRMDNGSYLFDVVLKSGNQTAWMLPDVLLNMGGLHNIENAIAAIMVAHHLAIPDAKIKDAVSAFKGVKRRFEYVVNTREHVLIDDYAHHPAELRALITGARGLFPGRKCTVIFQPHLFSRTRDFAAGFAEVLDLADEVILLPIYPARELPMEGVTSIIILEKMKNPNRVLLDKKSMLDHLEKIDNELLITAGAGDIDALVTPIKEILERKATAS